MTSSLVMRMQPEDTRPPMVAGLLVPLGALTQLVGDRLSVDCSAKPGVAWARCSVARDRQRHSLNGRTKLLVVLARHFAMWKEFMGLVIAP